MAASAGRPGELIQGINVTPLVDIVLVLLIAFMVAATHAVSQALPMELPTAKSGEASQQSPMAISIAADGRLFLDGKPATRSEIAGRARGESAKSGAGALIAADGRAPHRAVVAIIDLLRTQGVARFAINVAPEDVKP
jgi:biopolymer transport protein ExbD